MLYKEKAKPRRCPVCSSFLAYQLEKEPIHVYCSDCRWTYRINRKGEIASKHKGDLAWYDKDGYPEKDPS